MNKDFLIDYASYILFRALGFFIRSVPVPIAEFLGRRLGGLLYSFDYKHRAIAYANIKAAFPGKFSCREIKKVTRESYRCFGQSLIEVFLIPKVNKRYVNRYVAIEGLDNVEQGFRNGKGVIVLSVHAGSWELSNIIAALLGFPFTLLVRGQPRYKRIAGLLNHYRQLKGCRLIQRQNQTMGLIRALKNNEAVGMTIDQGGRDGIRVKFLGRYASMASGAVRLALKYNTVIIPGFYMRGKGARIRALLMPAFKIQRTGNREKDILANVEELSRIFEGLIAAHPKEYLWTYKLSKYAKEKNILILNDAKAGHLRQSQAAEGTVRQYLAEKGFIVNTFVKDVRFNNNISRLGLALASSLSGKYNCQGCLWCLRRFLKPDTYENLSAVRPDIIISCGSQAAAVNFIISRENMSKSIVIMKPSFLSTNRFDLVIMPKHDNPARRKNIVITEGALNLINEKYLREQAERLMNNQALKDKVRQPAISFLIGGNSKAFSLDRQVVLKVIQEIKSVSKELGGDILVTTSRRTDKEIEDLVKEEFKDYAACKLLIIANENNIPEAVGGMMGLSRITVISPESISMISEAVNSPNYVFVFDSKKLGRKHRFFIDNFANNKYIYLAEAENLGEKIRKVWLENPRANKLSDNDIVREALEKIL
jgi:Kdo2-lipid IVA lauroyltransferase/acyltransferase